MFANVWDILVSSLLHKFYILHLFYKEGNEEAHKRCFGVVTVVYKNFLIILLKSLEDML